MQVTTANFRAGGIGRLPRSKSAANVSLAVTISSTVAMAKPPLGGGVIGGNYRK